jgi:hypothetical protein
MKDAGSQANFFSSQAMAVHSIFTKNRHWRISQHFHADLRQLMPLAKLREQA